jgi:Asp-tRNA(Asn)/Glu-tRNA(Gln) amidotransferase C subunit
LRAAYRNRKKEGAMRDLKAEDVKAFAEATGVKVSEKELPQLAIRLNGMLGLLQQLESLPLEKAEIIPTLLTQRED